MEREQVIRAMSAVIIGGFQERSNLYFTLEKFTIRCWSSGKCFGTTLRIIFHFQVKLVEMYISFSEFLPFHI